MPTIQLRYQSFGIPLNDKSQSRTPLRQNLNNNNKKCKVQLWRKNNKVLKLSQSLRITHRNALSFKWLTSLLYKFGFVCNVYHCLFFCWNVLKETETTTIGGFATQNQCDKSLIGSCTYWQTFCISIKGSNIFGMGAMLFLCRGFFFNYTIELKAQLFTCLFWFFLFIKTLIRLKIFKLQSKSIPREGMINDHGLVLIWF